NAPGIAGLAAGVDWIARTGVRRLHTRETDLKRKLLAGLREVPGIRICSPEAPDDIGIVSLVHESIAPAELALMIDRSHGVQARAGLHCAPDAHAIMGTVRTGALRLSLGWASNEAHVDAAVAALREAAGAPVAPTPG